jgi:predicted nucleic acid-binding protein
VKVFLDTSVLVATFYQNHEHHAPSFELFFRCNKQDACCGAHSLAEVYSTLTGRPGKDRASQDEALLILGNIRERLEVVVLNESEYYDAIEASADAGIVGGGIYDALLGKCALKSGAHTIYTWNLKHFVRLGPEIARRVATPEHAAI